MKNLLSNKVKCCYILSQLSCVQAANLTVHSLLTPKTIHACHASPVSLAVIISQNASERKGVGYCGTLQILF